MTKFLYKIIGFLMLPILYFGLNMGMNSYFYRNQDLHLTNKNILIAGDSHPQQAINPEYFLSAKNIAQPAEPYVLSFWKLKKIFNSYVPDTLILGFAPHNISEFNDLKFSDKIWANEMFRRIYPIEEFSSITNDILIDYKGFYKVLWKETAFYPKRDHINYIGNYYNLNSSNVSDWETAVKRHYYKNDKQLNVSALAINYLDSIADLCKSKKTKLILASNPLHKEYLKHIPQTILTKYDLLAEKYNKIHIVFDKTKQQYPDSLYLNSDHLNSKGAKRFTNELIEYLQSQL
jgi:hypothetical protein